ncbi:hypothetical protein ADUPG1_013777 [Aduncisulcus paluster]|uniref:C2H2-type domain-containing protein n=1 Tax=Aduncisulcus paluster TaxID=2918883 RepID=A0ABQ5K4M6_9EUKA|nr:hypothetical protein ADUPG1_013777 [Aduncisulcus paluster]
MSVFKCHYCHVNFVNSEDFFSHLNDPRHLKEIGFEHYSIEVTPLQVRKKLYQIEYKQYLADKKSSKEKGIGQKKISPFSRSKKASDLAPLIYKEIEIRRLQALEGRKLALEMRLEDLTARLKAERAASGEESSSDHDECPFEFTSTKKK